MGVKEFFWDIMWSVITIVVAGLFAFNFDVMMNPLRNIFESYGQNYSNGFAILIIVLGIMIVIRQLERMVLKIRFGTDHLGA